MPGSATSASTSAGRLGQVVNGSEPSAAALREVTTNPAIQQKAETVGEQLRAEDGIARAVALIEEIAVRA